MSDAQLPSELLSIVGRVIEFALAVIACVALKALADPFFAGWFGGIIFTVVYFRVWEDLK